MATQKQIIETIAKAVRCTDLGEANAAHEYIAGSEKIAENVFKALQALQCPGMTDEDIDTSDIPELDEEFFNKAKVVLPGGRDDS